MTSPIHSAGAIWIGDDDQQCQQPLQSTEFNRKHPDLQDAGAEPIELATDQSMPFDQLFTTASNVLANIHAGERPAGISKCIRLPDL